MLGLSPSVGKLGDLPIPWSNQFKNDAVPVLFCKKNIQHTRS